MTCFEGSQQFRGGWVCRGLSVVEAPRLGHLSTEEQWEWRCWSRAEPGGPFRWPKTALQMEEVSPGAQVRGVSLGWGINTASTSLRTEAHLTRKSSEAARGVLSRIIKKKRSYFFHYFWKYCTSKLKSKVHLRITNTHTHTHACARTHTPKWHSSSGSNDSSSVLRDPEASTSIWAPWGNPETNFPFN